MPNAKPLASLRPLRRRTMSRARVDPAQALKRRGVYADCVVLMEVVAAGAARRRIDMPEYPAHLVREHTLYDGRRVLVRPVRRDDGALFASFLADLSPESRYVRFQKWIDAVPDRLVGFLTDVDYDQHMAIVCVAHSDSVERIVGDARYRLDATGTRCDFGIIVADSWHKSGVAGVLMHVLVRAARERGLGAMESQVLRANFEMLRFARALGFTAEPMPGDRTLVRIVKDLSANISPGPTERARATRAMPPSSNGGQLR